MISDRGSPSRSGSGYCPININLSGKRVLVLGGGLLAHEVAARFVDFGASVVVVASQAVPEIQEMAVTLGSRITIEKRGFGHEDEARISSKYYLIVVACSDSEQENMRALAVSRQASVLVHLPDNPNLSDVILPVVVKRGHLKIAVSTDGLCRQVAEALGVRIKAALGTQVDKYVLFLSSIREKLVELESDPQLGNRATQRKVVRKLAESEGLLLAVQRENFEEAQLLVQQVISEVREATSV